MNVFQKCRLMVKNDKVNLIYLSNDDMSLVDKEIMNYLNNRFPNRKFLLTYKSTNQLKFFNISEKVDFISQDLTSSEIGNNLLNFHMDTVFKIINPDLKNVLLNKYKDQMEDKKQELLDYLDSFRVQLQLLNINNCIFELKENGGFTIYTDSKKMMLGGLKDFKSYTMKYDIVTHFDLNEIKDLTNKYIKIRKDKND